MADMAYCVKCRTKREFGDSQVVTMTNGRPARQGPCPVCGTKLNQVLKLDDARAAGWEG